MCTTKWQIILELYFTLLSNLPLIYCCLLPSSCHVWQLSSGLRSESRVTMLPDQLESLHSSAERQNNKYCLQLSSAIMLIWRVCRKLFNLHKEMYLTYQKQWKLDKFVNWLIIHYFFKFSTQGLISFISLRTDTQITFSLHFTPLGIRLSSLVAQPGAFLVLETIILGYYSTHC